MTIDSATISGHQNAGVRINNITVVGEQAAFVESLTDSTGGTAGDICNDTTSSVKDDLASIVAKINAIFAILTAHGLMAAE